MSKICLAAALCAIATAFSAPAFAQAQPVRVGGLTCDAAPRVGLVVGSRQNLRCVFRSNATGRIQGSAVVSMAPGSCRMLKLMKLDDEQGYVIVRVSVSVVPPL